VAEIINWTGRVTVIPRSQLAELAKREDLQKTGVYVLVGPDAHVDRERIYIGEADEVFERLKQQDKDESKDFWNRACAITSKDQNITKAHGRYLESRLIDLATVAGRATLSNGNAPGLKTLPESDVADMEYFVEQLKMVFPVLGFTFLQPPATQGKPPDQIAAESPKLVMQEVGASATAYEIDGRFVVLKGSTARQQGTPAWDSYISLRNKLVDQKKLVPKDDKLFVFTEDVEFSSPSAAATVVAAANRNGRMSWYLDPGGQTYAEWKEAQVKAAEGAV
jgi:hypothetical protein